jgi:hypothetical protein
MSHMFGSEYDELVAQARLGAAYDNPFSDIVEERLPVPKMERRRRQEPPITLPEEVEADILEGAIFVPKRQT